MASFCATPLLMATGYLLGSGLHYKALVTRHSKGERIEMVQPSLHYLRAILPRAVALLDECEALILD